MLVQKGEGQLSSEEQSQPNTHHLISLLEQFNNPSVFIGSADSSVGLTYTVRKKQYLEGAK